MIDRQRGKILVECDSCDQVLDTETDDFTTALALVRREGWRMRKIAGEWLHGCPKCGAPT
jgi:uncharacterized C2H2 Zn-finger protein